MLPVFRTKRKSAKQNSDLLFEVACIYNWGQHVSILLQYLKIYCEV